MYFKKISCIIRKEKVEHDVKNKNMTPMWIIGIFGSIHGLSYIFLIKKVKIGYR